MTEILRTIGKAEIRKDAWQKAAGKALFTADIPVDNLKYGVVYRSPHHYARILEIDTTSALKMPVWTACPGSTVSGPGSCPSPGRTSCLNYC
jgi:CO/xanthine dehydrogenase Mo-binding subunit